MWNLNLAFILFQLQRLPQASLCYREPTSRITASCNYQINFNALVIDMTIFQVVTGQQIPDGLCSIFVHWVSQKGDRVLIEITPEIFGPESQFRYFWEVGTCSYLPG